MLMLIKRGVVRVPPRGDVRSFTYFGGSFLRGDGKLIQQGVESFGVNEPSLSSLVFGRPGREGAAQQSKPQDLCAAIKDVAVCKVVRPERLGMVMKCSNCRGDEPTHGRLPGYRNGRMIPQDRPSDGCPSGHMRERYCGSARARLHAYPLVKVATGLPTRDVRTERPSVTARLDRHQTGPGVATYYVVHVMPRVTSHQPPGRISRPRGLTYFNRVFPESG